MYSGQSIWTASFPLRQGVLETVLYCLLIMATFLKYAFDRSMLSWHDEVDLVMISDLSQA